MNALKLQEHRPEKTITARTRDIFARLPPGVVIAVDRGEIPVNTITMALYRAADEQKPASHVCVADGLFFVARSEGLTREQFKNRVDQKRMLAAHKPAEYQPFTQEITAAQ